MFSALYSRVNTGHSSRVCLIGSASATAWLQCPNKGICLCTKKKKEKKNPPKKCCECCCSYDYTQKVCNSWETRWESWKYQGGTLYNSCSVSGGRLSLIVCILISTNSEDSVIRRSALALQGAAGITLAHHEDGIKQQRKTPQRRVREAALVARILSEGRDFLECAKYFSNWSHRSPAFSLLPSKHGY